MKFLEKIRICNKTVQGWRHVKHIILKNNDFILNHEDDNLK